MSFLDYSGDAGDFSEATAACSPGGAACSAAHPAAPRRVHPLSWIVAAALIPILCWDAWRSLEEAKLRVQLRQSAVQVEAAGPAAFGLPRRGL